MTAGRVLRRTAQLVPGLDEPIRQDLVESVELIVERSGCVARGLETCSLIGFALRSMSRRGALDDRRELIRQGLRVGALVLAIAGALDLWSSAADAKSVVLAAAGSATAVAIARGFGGIAMATAVATLLAQVVVTGSPSACWLLVLGAVALGHRFDARGCPIGGVVCAVALAAGGATAVLLTPATVGAILAVAVVMAVGGLLALGWYDPRYAVAATLVWFWRFVAVDVGELGEAVTALGDRSELRLFLAGWVLMGVGVLVAWQFSDAAIKRCLTVFR